MTPSYTLLAELTITAYDACAIWAIVTTIGWLIWAFRLLSWKEDHAVYSLAVKSREEDLKSACNQRDNALRTLEAHREVKLIDGPLRDTILRLPRHVTHVTLVVYDTQPGLTVTADYQFSGKTPTSRPCMELRSLNHIPKDFTNSADQITTNAH